MAQYVNFCVPWGGPLFLAIHPIQPAVVRGIGASQLVLRMIFLCLPAPIYEGLFAACVQTSVPAGTIFC